jgi:hypothetical protein
MYNHDRMFHVCVDFLLSWFFAGSRIIALEKKPIEETHWPDELEPNHVYKTQILTADQETIINILARLSLVEQWKFLKALAEHCVISGPPGTGKSSLAHAWSIYSHFRLGKDTIYIWLTTGIIWVAVLQKEGEKSVYQVGNTTMDCSPVIIMQALLQDFPHTSLIVIDGLRAPQNSEMWVGAAKKSFLKKKELRFVFLSSIQLSIKWEKDETLVVGEMEPAFESWSLEEYQTACENLDLWQQVQKSFDIPWRNTPKRIRDAVSDKHFYAGGCARWMFNLKILDICKIINNHVRRVKNFEDLWTQSGGDATQGAVNTLIQVTYSKTMAVVDTSLISAYAFQAVGKKADPKVVVGMWNWALLKKNGAIIGWAYEARCISEWTQSRQAIKLDLTYLDTVGIASRSLRSGSKRLHESSIQQKQVKSHNLELSLGNKPQDRLLDLLSDGKVPDKVDTNDLGSVDLILLPLLWNHGCFDIVFVKPKAVYCIQCTVQEHHNRKIDFIYSLLDSLKSKGFIPDSVNLIGCVPKKQFSKFVFHDVSELDTQNGPEIICWKTQQNFKGV